jgi:low affinity Fe/Cu permease
MKEECTLPKKSNKGKKSSGFSAWARNVSCTTGKPMTFFVAVAIIVIWAITGPLFHFNDTWQLVINTGTTIVTFLMVFLIQNTQNRDSEAVQLKLDELIRAIEAADDDVINLEDKSQEELDEAKKRYLDLAENAQTALNKKQKGKGRKAS